MVARISQPMVASVMPYCSSTERCPSAVAPPWLPMAGKTNGRAPCALSQSTVARTMTAMLAMPRLPAPTATVSPRLMGRVAPARVFLTPPGMSSRRVRGKVCRTRCIVGSVTDPSGMAGS